LARLSFQNVPSPTGGVMSGNVSIASGSPFGSGGKYAETIAHVQSEIAKKPKGYYDPILNASGNVDTSVQAMEIALNMNPAQFKSETISMWEKVYGDARRRQNQEEYKAKLDAERIKVRNEQLKLHADALTIRLNNGQLVAPPFFQNSIIQKQAGVITDEQFLKTYKILWDNGTIHEKIIVEKPVPVEIPTPTPSTPTPSTPTPSTPTPAVTSSLPIIPIIIIAVIVGFFLLRRRA